MRGNLRFLFAAVIAPPLAAASLAAIVMALVGDAAWQTDAQRWFAANALGLPYPWLPVGSSASWRKIAKLRLRERAGEAAIVFLALALVSLYAIRWAPHPIPFIILPVALAATVRFRLPGAGTAMLVIVIVVLTSNLSAKTPDEYVLSTELMQMFMAVTSLIRTSCSAIVLNERDLHLAYTNVTGSAVRASRFKSQLLSHVGEEARGPLSAIIVIPRCWNPASWRPNGPGIRPCRGA